MKRNVRTGKSQGKDSKSFLLICLSWFLILAWVIFLVFCWQSGMIHEPNVPIVKDVLNKSKVVLRGTLDHLIVPIEHLPVGSSAIKQNLWSQSDIHVIFSTDCTPYQDWQTLLLFHSAVAIGQKGPITRIASGCDDLKKLELRSLYKKLYPFYYVHFTPDFKKDEKSKRSYDFYNKPWGLKHWLENADPPVPDDVVIALLDPDMIFVRPLTTKMRGQPNNVYNKRLYETENDIMEKIVEGKPAAQMYGLGAPWTDDYHKKFNRTHVCGAGSPCLKPERAFGEQHYSVGPPYVVHKRDMVKIASSWTKFVPRVYERYPYLLAEMYAYSMAAAHENLPHLQFEHFMVSNTDSPGEGWPLIDKIENVCEPPVNGIYLPGTPLPTVVHYCQNFRAGLIGFAKRRAPKDMFSCEAPIFVEPPSNLDKSETRIHKNKVEKISAVQAKRNAYAICVIHRSLNAALLDFKKRMCVNAPFVNLNKTVNVLAEG